MNDEILYIQPAWVQGPKPQPSQDPRKTSILAFISIAKKIRIMAYPKPSFWHYNIVISEPEYLLKEGILTTKGKSGKVTHGELQNIMHTLFTVVINSIATQDKLSEDIVKLLNNNQKIYSPNIITKKITQSPRVTLPEQGYLSQAEERIQEPDEIELDGN